MGILEILKFVEAKLKLTNRLLKVMKKDGSPKARRQVVACNRLSNMFSDLAEKIKAEDRNGETRERSTSI